MKVFVVISLVVAAGLARPDGDQYDSKYDDVDIKTLVDDPALLKEYALCLLDKGSCTEDGASFKKVLPEQVQTTCAKCTPKQRVLVRTFVKALQEKLPEQWEELIKKHDPEGTHKESFTKFLQSSD